MNLFSKKNTHNGLVLGISKDGTFYTIYDYIGESMSVEVPERYNGLEIKEISGGVKKSGYSLFSFNKKGAFQDKKICKISLPKTIIKIGANAFKGCNHLSEIFFSDGISEICEYAFEGCSLLNVIRLPKTIQYVHSSAFNECDSLQVIIVENSTFVLKIGTPMYKVRVFLTSDFNEKQNMELKNKVYCVYYNNGWDFFNGTPLPIKLDAIFKDNNGVTKLIEKVSYGETPNPPIMDDFEYKKFKKWDKKIEKIYKNITYNAIYNNYYEVLFVNLEGHVIKKEIVLEGKNANPPFEADLGMMWLGNYKNIINHTKILLSKSIYNYHQDENGNITLYDILDTELREIEIPGFINGMKVTRLGIDYGYKWQCITRNLHKIEKIVIPKTVEIIEAGAFHSSESLREIIFEKNSNLRLIGRSAFYWSREISKIDFPNKLEVIGESAFSGCTNLKDVVFPDSLVEIQDGAFSYCKNLVKIELKDNLISIGKKAFRSCEKLEQVKISNMINKISSEMFWGCDNLQQIELPENIEMIDKKAFNACKKLEKVIVHNPKIKFFNSHVFSNCPNLNKLDFPKGYEQEVPIFKTKIVGDIFDDGRYDKYPNQYYVSKLEQGDKVVFTIDERGTICVFDSTNHKIGYVEPNNSANMLKHLSNKTEITARVEQIYKDFLYEIDVQIFERKIKIDGSHLPVDNSIFHDNIISTSDALEYGLYEEL